MCSKQLIGYQVGGGGKPTRHWSTEQYRVFLDSGTRIHVCMRNTKYVYGGFIIYGGSCTLGRVLACLKVICWNEHAYVHVYTCKCVHLCGSGFYRALICTRR